MLKLIHTLTLKEFELPRNLKIPFLFFNPIFEEQGSTTYSATMSGQSAVNRELTGYQHRPGKQNNSNKLIPVWLEHSSQRKRCTLNIIEADANEIKFNLLMDEGSFLAEHGEKKLNELDYGGEQTIVGAGLPDWDDDFYTKTYPEINCAFPPVYNDQFFDGTPYETNYKLHSNVLNRPYNLITTSGFGLYPICPAPFLNYIINCIFKNFEYNVLKNSIDIEPFRQLILLNNVDNAKVEVHMVDGIDIGSNSDHRKYDLANHVPAKTIKSFLASLRGKFNIISFINESSGTVELLNFDDILNVPVNIDDDLSAITDKLKLSLIPSFTGIEFIDNGEKTPKFSENYVDLKDVQNKLILPETLYADLLNGYFKLNGIYKVNHPNYFGYSYYQLIFNSETSKSKWTNLGLSDIGNIYFGIEGNLKKFESEFGFTFYQSFPLGDLSNMASYQASGISEFIDFNSEKDFGMVLAFYKPSTNEKAYPEAGYIDSIDINNTLMPGTKRGTVNKFFKSTIDFYLTRGRVYETIINLPVAKLFNFNFAKKYKIHQGTYLVKNIKGNFTMDGIEYTSAEVVEV